MGPTVSLTGRTPSATTPPPGPSATHAPNEGIPLKDWPLRELRRRHTLALVDHMLRTEGRATTGAVSILRALSAMAEDAITDEVCDLNPFKGFRIRAMIRGRRRSRGRSASSLSRRCTASQKQQDATRQWSASSPTAA